FPVTVMRIDPPSPGVTTPTPGGGIAPGLNLTGTVSGMTVQGQPIVQTPQTALALGTLAPAQDGARVVLRVDGQPALPQLTRLGPLPATLHGLAQPGLQALDSLDEAMNVLATADPARFQQVAQATLPQPGPRLTAQLLFFLAALKGGDFTSWAGENTARAIEHERPGLLNRLIGDFQMMSKLSDEPQTGDWRIALIPLWVDEEIKRLRLMYRGGGRDEEDGEDEDGTRFVLDVILSLIGRVQIDGLAKRKARKLDIIVRTELPLPDDMRTEIMQIYTQAGTLLGLGGQLAFQAAPGNFIEAPEPDAVRGAALSTPGLMV
ncbi:MAG: hypothetical protein HQL35_13435, partial [Alphaproteobacteria bacterium]|nr:hypothetical protein [Alphaproteobacteria bacterium]